MSDAVEVSRSEAIKERLLKLIIEAGGRVEGRDLSDIRQSLGLDGTPTSVLKSALWKLVNEDGKLVYHGERDHEGCDPRGYPEVCNRIYAIRR